MKVSTFVEDSIMSEFMACSLSDTGESAVYGESCGMQQNEDCLYDKEVGHKKSLSV